MENTHILTNNLNGAQIEVHATTNNSASSYGIPVWVDSDGQAYCQVGLETPFYTVTPLQSKKIMNAEKFSQKTLNGAVVSSSMRLKAIDVIDGENIVTVIDSEGDEWKCKESEGDVDWGNGEWLSWRREGE